MSLLEKNPSGKESCQAAPHGCSCLETPGIPQFTYPAPELSKRNLQAKNALSRELKTMGFSPEAISRVLHIDRE
jgi:hypothetical protein